MRNHETHLRILCASAPLREISFGLLIVMVFSATVTASEIRLKGEAAVSGPLVRLGDIAEIEGEAAADGPSLADLALFPSPGAGKSRMLRRQELVQLLALCDVPVREWQFGGADVVEIRAGGKAAKTIVRPALHLIPSRSFVKTDESNPADKPADPSADKPQPLIKRNTLVTVHSIAAGVRVATSGKSLADAAKGQPVLVELADNKEKVLARVVGPQLVEIRVP
jgi:hypothetical protein